MLPQRTPSEGCSTERLLISSRPKLSRQVPAAVPPPARRNPGPAAIDCETPELREPD